MTNKAIHSGTLFIDDECASATLTLSCGSRGAVPMKSCLPGSPDGNAAGEQEPRFRLDPARLPQRIELELSDAVIEAISHLMAAKRFSLPHEVGAFICAALTQEKAVISVEA